MSVFSGKITKVTQVGGKNNNEYRQKQPTQHYILHKNTQLWKWIFVVNTFFNAVKSAKETEYNTSVKKFGVGKIFVFGKKNILRSPRLHLNTVNIINIVKYYYDLKQFFHFNTSSIVIYSCDEFSLALQRIYTQHKPLVCKCKCVSVCAICKTCLITLC